MTVLRPTTTARGYGAEHRKLRAGWARKVAAGSVLCARCGKLIFPGAEWDLDHTDDRSDYLGPSHAACNRATAAHRAGTFRTSRPVELRSRDW